MSDVKRECLNCDALVWYGVMCGHCVRAICASIGALVGAGLVGAGLVELWRAL